MRGLRLGRRARDDLARLHADGAGQFGMEQAERYFADLERTLSFLAEYPFAAREHLETTPPVRVHPFRSHLIIYRIDDRGVLVLRVRHAREDWRRDPII